MSNVLAVVDVQQLFLAARDENGPLARVDYLKLRRLFEDPSNKNDPNDPNEKVVVDAIAYMVVSPKHEDVKFVRLLKKMRYRVFRLYAKVENADRYGDGLSNVRVIPRTWTFKMVKELHAFVNDANRQYDKFYIVSGSNQFVSPINAIHANNKKVSVVAFKSSLSSDFKKTGADEYIILDRDYLYDENLYRPKEELGPEAKPESNLVPQWNAPVGPENYK